VTVEIDLQAFAAARATRRLRRSLPLLGLSLGLAVAPALAGCSSSATTSTSSGVTVDGVKHLDVADFAALAATPGTVVLDVRTPAEFATGHLAGARNLDLRAVDFDTRLAALDRGISYAVYCHSGNRSGQALDRMKAAGFTHVGDLSGGVTAWASAGKPLTTA